VDLNWFLRNRSRDWILKFFSYLLLLVGLVWSCLPLNGDTFPLPLARKKMEEKKPWLGFI